MRFNQVSYANNPTAVGIRTADSTSSMILQVLRGTTQMEAYVRATSEGQWRRPKCVVFPWVTNRATTCC